MTSELIRRLEALERRMNAERPSDTLPRGGPLRVVIIHGCLPPGEPLFAAAGEHEWLREPGEDLDAFADRARAAALELKEPLLVIGGLPATQAQQDLAMAAYDAWLLTDDGVPPCEPSRGMAR
ncbi:hypothetical protein ACVIHI_002575 [Bradyrhizobium sp. USDA 4524]|uniref:hypothetical protein n=1 Tax=unclassified Bradyrhizobium TaxID=2631580 RepID=UPI00209FB03B|nr:MULTISPECIES: hypothetical protein [unclassified Bradyrhizobium]MCP1844503.1 hypothetical protein [Bradyrhizobium sp. USDA 4538]MCP1905069.1 hypothetical protein [Bradyrhizobium sp. USDA 4537]MCP1989275.1 hypothetical protein [Bradyrhizobium sp. USDA 4539]